MPGAEPRRDKMDRMAIKRLQPQPTAIATYAISVNLLPAAWHRTAEHFKARATFCKSRDR